MAVYAMTFMGMAPMGALLAGAAAQRIGAPATVAAGGVVSVLGALVFAARLPSLRVQAREIIVSEQLTGGAPADEMTGVEMVDEE
jgi:hypothetical protein